MIVALVGLCRARSAHEASGFVRPCDTCVLVGWARCGTAQGAQSCPEGTFSFFPGATTSASCLPCPGDTFANGTSAVWCRGTTMTVAPGWWLDPQSIYDGAPAVYSCDVLDGCAGIVYSAPNQTQCYVGYGQVRYGPPCPSVCSSLGRGVSRVCQ